MGPEVETEQHVADAGANVLEPFDFCQRKFFCYCSWWVKRGVVMVGACTSAANRAELGTSSLPFHRLPQLRQWHGLVLDRSEDAVNGEKEDGKDEDVQR